MNGSSEQFQLRVLTVLIPVWLLVLPGLVLINHDPLWTIGMFTVIMACAYGFAFFLKNELVFSKDALKLPGIWHPTFKLSEITRVYLDKTLLCFEAETPAGPFKQKCSVAGLSRESAEHLWAILASRLRGADIDSNVRQQFKNWVGSGEEPLAIEASADLVRALPGNDLQLVLDIQAHSRLKQILAYMATYEATGYRTWKLFWFGVAGVIVLAGIVHSLLPETAWIATRDASIFQFIGRIFELLFSLWDPAIALMQLVFANAIGAFGYLFVLIAGAYVVIKGWTEPDSIFIEKMGVTALLKTPTGTVPQEHIGWQSIKQIKLLRHQGSSSIANAIVQIIPDTDRLPIEIPLRSFSGEKRELFLEALNSWGRKITIDPKLLESLSTPVENSYTELWLSALESAPQLSQLTPLMEKEKLKHHGLEIEKLLASGGQGVTYLARWSEQPDSPRVVLKEIIIPIYIEKAKQKVAERFERDARLLKSLDHPQIVKLHDFFIEEHRAFLMLEFIAGTTLQDKIHFDGPMPEGEVIVLIRQMLEILDYLHGRTPPVVHRDFTPDNLIIGDDNQIKLIDFDVALQADQAVKSKATIVGKQNFLPPEQFRGHPCPQSDIYALGATLYFLLTAREPEALSSSKPQLVITNISNRLDQFIARCTEPELNRRFRNIEDMKKDLDEFAPLTALEVAD